MTEPAFSFGVLRRAPDIEGSNLYAYDATDSLLLDLAADLVVADPTLRSDGACVVIGDRHGALSLGARELLGVESVRTHQDGLVNERAIRANAARLGVRRITTHRLGAELVLGARLVLLQLPRSLAALDEISGLIADHAAADVTLLAGGRVKHMSLGMNDVLGAHWGRVSPTRARQKSRALVVTEPRRGVAASYPMRGTDPRLDFDIVAHGAAFNGTRLDIGTRALLDAFERTTQRDGLDYAGGRAIDLACGTGILATAIARRFPRVEVIASDQSSAAVDSAAETARSAGVASRVRVVRDDALTEQRAESADLVLLNPPFHVGATVHTGIAERLIMDAGRVLRPGGQLWTVWNSHLGYRPLLTRAVGPTEQIARTSKFSVTRSTRR